jgi:hypothetical protein
VCVESETAGCTKKDPCKVLAIDANFLSSFIIYLRVFRHRNKNRLHRVQVVAIGGRATMCFGSAFGVAAVFAPTLIFSSRKISNDFSTEI